MFPTPFLEVYQEPVSPCSNSICGENAYCKEQNGVGACFCKEDFFGNPYEGCRRECILSSDCPSHLACVNYKCKDICPGSCSVNSECRVVNHNVVCTCIAQYTGDPYNTGCHYQRDERKIWIFFTLWYLWYLSPFQFFLIPFSILSDYWQ